ncbi:hypothetical protein EJB05_08895, partial [Eragrostis curvula]
MPSNSTFLPPPGCAPKFTTSSTSAVETVEGTHIFHISGYSLLRDLGDDCVQSGTFSVGGYDWCIWFSPGIDPDCSFHTKLVSDDADVRASFTFGLVSKNNGLTSWCGATAPIVFSTTGRGPSGAHFIAEKRKLEAFSVHRSDRFTVACTVSVIKDAVVSSASKAVSGVEVPPPDLPLCFRRLLEEGVGADVKFSVGKETFSAHRIVLAMRSPVFKAVLYGSMREERTRHVAIEDMQPAVFKALLHFIYTDSLPSMDALDILEKNEMIRHLLVAADRYGMERLGDVVASEEFVDLKTTCPSVLVEILERSSKFTRT